MKKQVQLWHLHPLGVMISAVDGDEITISICDKDFNNVISLPERKPAPCVHAA